MKNKAGHFRRGFTITEMIVAVSLLVVLIMAAGQIFKGAASAVNLSMLNTEVTSNVHAAANQMRQDIAGMDTNSFLVIRSVFSGGRHLDMLAFVANGSFPNRTGTLTAANPTADHTYANSAMVTYGHGLIGAGTAADEALVANQASDDSTVAGYTGPGTTVSGALGAAQWVLCRNTTVLLAPGATANQVTSLNAFTVPAYTDISGGGASLTFSAETAQISSGRWCTAAMTTGQLLRSIRQTVIPGYGGTYISDNYCYRFRVLPNAYASATNMTGGATTTSGAYRMHPILLQGCKSFWVQYTDGTNTGGVLNWYPAASTATTIFDWRTLSNWPKALKIVYSATDQADRLNGGKEFTQVIPLPREGGNEPRMQADYLAGGVYPPRCNGINHPNELWNQ